jgi:hypothetical protein
MLHGILGFIFILLLWLVGWGVVVGLLLEYQAFVLSWGRKF